MQAILVQQELAQDLKGTYKIPGTVSEIQKTEMLQKAHSEVSVAAIMALRVCI